MRLPLTTEEKIFVELEKITALLQDLFILEAARMGVRKEPLRQILGIDKRRIGRIAKHVVVRGKAEL